MPASFAIRQSKRFWHDPVINSSMLPTFTAIWLVFFQNRITVQLNMYGGENGRLVPATRARRRISPERWEQIKTAYASGIGLREIARNLGISEGTVLSRAKREGWTRQINNVKALTKRDTSTAVAPFEAASASMQQRGERYVERMAGVSERAVDHIETMDGPEILNSVNQIEKLDKVARRTFGLDTENGNGGNVMVNVALLEIPPEETMVSIEPSGD
jgi:hypothetical protein